MNPKSPCVSFHLYVSKCCDWKNVVDRYTHCRLGAFIFDLIEAICALKHFWTMSWRWCVFIHVIVVAKVAIIVIKSLPLL